MPNANPTAAACRGARRPVSLPLLPLPKADHLAPTQAGQLAKRGRELLRAGEITHRELALLDCLLWSCRRPGQDLAVASYSALCRLVHMAKATVAAALAKLEALDLIARIKRRVRLSWHQGGERSLQAISCYRLRAPASDAKVQTARPGEGTTAVAHSEFSGRTVNREIQIFYQEQTANDDVEAARKALAAIRERRQLLLGALFRRDRPGQ